MLCIFVFLYDYFSFFLFLFFYLRNWTIHSELDVTIVWGHTLVPGDIQKLFPLVTWRGHLNFILKIGLENEVLWTKILLIPWLALHTIQLGRDFRWRLRLYWGVWWFNWTTWFRIKMFRHKFLLLQSTLFLRINLLKVTKCLRLFSLKKIDLY